MDATKLRQIFENLDQALEHPTELLIQEGAAVLAYGLQQRATLDIDVLPASRFVEADLRQACAAADLGFNPADKDFAEHDYLEVIPEETLILPRPAPDRGYNTPYPPSERRAHSGCFSRYVKPPAERRPYSRPPPSGARPKSPGISAAT
jgi:hypothetical protein